MAVFHNHLEFSPCKKMHLCIVFYPIAIRLRTLCSAFLKHCTGSHWLNILFSIFSKGFLRTLNCVFFNLNFNTLNLWVNSYALFLWGRLTTRQEHGTVLLKKGCSYRRYQDWKHLLFETFRNPLLGQEANNKQNGSIEVWHFKTLLQCKRTQGNLILYK